MTVTFLVAMANRADPDEMLHAAASHLGLHCLLVSLCIKLDMN